MQRILAENAAIVKSQNNIVRPQSFFVRKDRRHKYLVPSITKSPSVLESIPNPVNSQSGDQAWDRLDNGVSSDNLYAVADFSTPAGTTVSEGLWSHGYAFNLPSTAFVDGIQPNLERKAAGTITDQQIRISFGSTPIFTAPEANIANWSLTEATVSYGGASDRWNRNWPVAQVNDVNFGVLLAVNGTRGSSAAYIDVITLTVYYHNVYTEVGSGGVKCNSTATKKTIYRPKPTGGVVLDSHSPINYDIKASGGILADSTAEAVNFYNPQGGVVANGDASFTNVYQPQAADGVVIGTTADQTFIDYADGTGGTVVDGTSYVEHGIYPEGGAVLDGTGDLWVFYKHPNHRAGVVIGGLSMVEPFIGTGGILAGGTADVDCIYSPAIDSDGDLVGGQVPVSITVPTGGGILAGTGADFWRSIDIPDFSIHLTSDTTDATGHADIWVGFNSFEQSYMISWRISFTGFDQARVARIWDNQENGINNLFNYTHQPPGDHYSPIVGHKLLDANDWSYFQSTLPTGDWQVSVVTDDNSDEIHGLLEHSGVVADGTALVKPFFEVGRGGVKAAGLAYVHPFIALGGTKAGGSATVSFIDYVNGTGGVVASGVSNRSVIRTVTTNSGGMVADGNAIRLFRPSPTIGGGIVAGTMAQVILPMIAKGGIVVDSSVYPEFTINITAEGGIVVDSEVYPEYTSNIDTSGGGFVGTKFIVGIMPAVGGGIFVNSTSDIICTYTIEAEDGVVADGSGRQTFIDYFTAEGGTVTNGNGRVQRRVLHATFRTGYGRTMTDNILSNPPDTSEKLIRPTSDITPPFADRFEVEEEGAWCDVEDACPEGVLPKIVQSRQNGHYPPKLAKYTKRRNPVLT